MEVVELKKPDNAKERGLIKGALRRVFSRSDLRRNAVNKAMVSGYYDPDRKRVTKWGKCEGCGKMEPLYLMQADHIMPVVPIHMTLEDMTWDELVDRLWCDEKDLQILCKPCHLVKSKLENKERRLFKKGNKK